MWASARVRRHFPSRQVLVPAVLTGHVARRGGETRAALADPDSRRAPRGAHGAGAAFALPVGRPSAIRRLTDLLITGVPDEEAA